MKPKRPVGRPKAEPTKVIRIRLLVPDYDALEAKGGYKADKVAKVVIEKYLKRKG